MMTEKEIKAPNALFLAWYNRTSARKRALRSTWVRLAFEMFSGRARERANMPEIHLQLYPVRD